MYVSTIYRFFSPPFILFWLSPADFLICKDREEHVAPVWQGDATAGACVLCNKPFTVFFRRHHCRKWWVGWLVGGWMDWWISLLIEGLTTIQWQTCMQPLLSF